jgi:isopenicillin N synthase-like dioxygenase
MATEFQEIPILDLADLENRKYEIAKDLYTYSKDIGFFYIKVRQTSETLNCWSVKQNTGCLEDVLPTVFEAARQFFALPPQEKQTLSMANSTEFRGYLGLECVLFARVQLELKSDRGMSAE